VSLDACTTRLRLVMANQSLVDEAALKRLGARGMIKPSATALQVVVGAEADQVAGEMRVALRALPAAASAGTAGALPAGGAPHAPVPSTPAAHAPAPNALGPSTPAAVVSGIGNPLGAPPVPAAPAVGAMANAHGSMAAPAAVGSEPSTPAAPPIPTQTLSSLLAALGGRTNIRAVESASTRLRINIVDPKAVDEGAISSLGLRGVARAAPNWVHVIVGPQAATASIALRQLL